MHKVFRIRIRLYLLVVARGARHNSESRRGCQESQQGIMESEIESTL